MNTASEAAPPPPVGRPANGPRAWLSRAETWLDERGKGAWIAAMVLGFVFFWPLGLAILAYMIWSKRMFSGNCSRRGGMTRGGDMDAMRHGAMRPTGNTAFDTYKAETLRRLMDEQAQFESFLERLREAKDKQEFDQFMEERARAAAAGTASEASVPVESDAQEAPGGASRPPA